ncbi:aldehyde dehydrogenase PuuC [Endozoicomonas sp. OPT23]|uniref:aldehyde dehydrogenase n=1 Tax=Endozoicomonas sp. OPT23 TaxID=2072845 RepID=UPI00129B5BEC|nr:aldehyde dehydrogenase [Endozoicomonas sp. OPT23]MRI32719.1 aldehyde dehydrogenase PuuC [Endozoicomonas sp. OPT23]
MSEKNYSYWLKQSEQLAFARQAYINGQYCDALSGETMEVISPRDGKVLTSIASCDEADIDLAVKAARGAFEAGAWSNQSPKQRKKVLLKFAQLIEQHSDELAVTESLDMGMTISDSSTMNLPGSVECVSWYAELVDKLYDEIAPTHPNSVTRIHRVPLGVVAAIVPWNYPLMIACWKLAPALAAGNSVVLKPSEQSSLTALRIAALATEAGIPDGVFNVVPGYGHTAGKALGLHMDVDALAFTGSTRVGGLYMQYAGQSNLKRVSLECGGKTPNIVLADAPDLDKAADGIVIGAFSNQGQICNAGSRLIVESSIKDALMVKVLERVASLRQGDPLDPETEIGPLVDASHLNNVAQYIDLGKEQGARLVTGGTKAEPFPDKLTGNCYLEPTIFTEVSAEMAIAKEEIFGPVLSVITVDDLDQAIEVANSTVYGLGAAIWTSNLLKMEKAAKAIQAGVIWVNSHDHGDISSPVGGFKQSGFGRDKSAHAFDKYTEFKAVWINLV